jgi:hypothetical protein
MEMFKEGFRSVRLDLDIEHFAIEVRMFIEAVCSRKKSLFVPMLCVALSGLCLLL